MNSPDIVFIINSFNRLYLLKDCLGVLANWLPQSVLKDRCTLLVYEAGSTDGSVEWLKGEALTLKIPIEVIIPAPGEDTSFAAGLNAGVSHAEKKFPSVKYLLFYETDNQILSVRPILQAISKLEENCCLSACGFTVRLHNGKPAGVGMPFPTLLNFALGNNFVHKLQLEKIRYKWQRNALGIDYSEVDIVFTSPLLVRVEAWRESGGLNAIAFPFSDCDVDWARRMRNTGWRMGVIRSNDVIHDNTGTLSSWSKTRAMQFHRGRLRYFQLHHPISIFLAWPFLLSLRHVFEFVLVKLTEKDPIRRAQLSNQFISLLKACPRKYE